MADVATPAGVSMHYTCTKGNEHVLSHVTDWDGDQEYYDNCRVHIRIEGGHIARLTVLPDVATGPGDHATPRGVTV